MLFQAKIFTVLLVLTVFCAFNVIGKPNPLAELNLDGGLTENFSLNRTKRAECSQNFGCSNGKCWADCIGFLAGWCYTTKELEKQNGKYVECTEDRQCSRCWYCAGPCGNF